MRKAREALKSDDPGKIDPATEKNNRRLSQACGTDVQEAAGRSPPQGAGEGGAEDQASESGQGNSTSGDDVIDAEFTEQK